MKLINNIFKRFVRSKKRYSGGDEMWLSSPLFGKELDWQTSKVVAKILSLESKNETFHRNMKQFKCEVCSRVLVKELNPGYRAEKSRAPIYFVFGGYFVANDRFKEFCDDNNYPGLVFIPLPKSPGYYWFYPTIEYKVDWGRGITERSRRCLNCGHTCFSKSNPMFKMPDFNPPSDDFIYRTDIEYGATFCSPLIIIGLKTEAKLLKAGFKGMHYDPVYF